MKGAPVPLYDLIETFASFKIISYDHEVFVTKQCHAGNYDSVINL